MHVWLCLIPVLALIWVDAAGAKGIEAVRGKKYRLTKQHGPWMIMVASLAEPPPERRVEGMSPKEAADELVYELRRKRIPAYTYSQKEEIERIGTVDRLGRQRQRAYLARHDGICVIAGNYKSVDDTTAQRTLAFIKQYEPKSWEKSGIYKETPGRPGPLSGAFLTMNPLLTPEEVARREQDPLLLRLNSGKEYSLLSNKGQYTLAVASFQGKSVTGINTSKFQNTEKEFQVGSKLDEAAVDAWQLTKALREMHNEEAYVYHDRHRSVVTVGSFNSPTDPRIAQFSRRWGGKMVRHRDTGQELLTAEFVVIPGRKPNDPPLKRFILNPQPQLTEVPKLR